MLQEHNMIGGFYFNLVLKSMSGTQSLKTIHRNHQNITFSSITKHTFLLVIPVLGLTTLLSYIMRL